MHEGDLDGVGVCRVATTERLVSAPHLAADDLGLRNTGPCRRRRTCSRSEVVVLRSHGVVDHGELGVTGHRARGRVDAHLNAVTAVGRDRLRRVARALALIGRGVGHVLADRKFHPRLPLATLPQSDHDAGARIEGLGGGDADEPERLRRRGRGRSGGAKARPSIASLGSDMDMVLPGHGHRGGRRGGGGERAGSHARQRDRGDGGADRPRIGRGDARGHGEGEGRGDDEGSRQHREESHRMRVPQPLGGRQGDSPFPQASLITFPGVLKEPMPGVRASHRPDPAPTLRGSRGRGAP